jgi:hypothetical protein
MGDKPARLRLINAGSRIGMLRGQLPMLEPGDHGPDAEGAQRKRLMDSKRWKTLRARVLREEPACRLCGAPACVADHIHGHGDEGWRERFFERAAVQGLCARCHNSKTAKHEQHGVGGRRKASLVRIPKAKGWDGAC